MTPFVDFIELDRMAFSELGLSPRAVDQHSWRDLWVMFSGAYERRKEAWMHTSVIAQSVANHGGNPTAKPQGLLYLYEQMFGRKRSVEPMDGGRVRALLSSIAKKADASG